ncbi:MAG: AEC family transporter [Ardenticatenaceae bacterium]|nr:AEC family transporter [Ardenticatenaceae bacterium]
MLLELAEVFINVVTPVFLLVVIGYVAGPRLGLEARTLSRYAYYILIPAFVYNLTSTAKIEVGLALRMFVFILLVHLAAALVGLVVPRLLGRSGTMTAAMVLVAIFGNVGNFGLPIIEFGFGPEALLPATFYFLAIMLVSFVIGVAAANWQKGGSLGAVTAVLKTPALIALVPALLVNGTGINAPLVVERVVGLLAAAMVPTMLVALGVQLAATKKVRFDRDVLLATGIRLLVAPLLALALAGLFGLTGLERNAGVLQAGMPTAVLASIIALEYDLIPDFVTTTVLFSTIVSVVTLTIWIVVL